RRQHLAGAILHVSLQHLQVVVVGKLGRQRTHLAGLGELLGVVVGDGDVGGRGGRGSRWRSGQCRDGEQGGEQDKWGNPAVHGGFLRRGRCRPDTNDNAAASLGCTGGGAGRGQEKTRLAAGF